MAPSLAGPSAGGQRSLTGSGYSRRRHKPSIAAIICFWFIYIWYLSQFLLRIMNFKEHIYLINQHIYPISRHFLETSWRFPLTDHSTRMEWCWLFYINQRIEWPQMANRDKIQYIRDSSTLHRYFTLQLDPLCTLSPHCAGGSLIEKRWHDYLSHIF